MDSEGGKSLDEQSCLKYRIHHNICLTLLLTEYHWKLDFLKHLLLLHVQFCNHTQFLPGDGRIGSPTEVK